MIPAWKHQFEKVAGPGLEEGYAWDPRDVTAAIEALSEILGEVAGAKVGDTKKHLEAALTSISKVSESLELYDMTDGLKALLRD